MADSGDEPDRSYEIVVARPAATTIAEDLPEAVAAAVIELITGPLLENPRRLGVPLRNELRGCGASEGAHTASCTGSTTHGER